MLLPTSDLLLAVEVETAANQHLMDTLERSRKLASELSMDLGLHPQDGLGTQLGIAGLGGYFSADEAEAIARRLGRHLSTYLSGPAATFMDQCRAIDRARATARGQKPTAPINRRRLAEAYEARAPFFLQLSRPGRARELALAFEVDRTSFVERYSQATRASGPALARLLELHARVVALLAGLVLVAEAVDQSQEAMPVGLDPVQDEQATFEQLWQVIDRALESGVIDRALAEEVESLSKLLRITQYELDPDRYQDVYMTVSGKLVAILPDIMRAVLDDAVPIPTSVQIAADGAPLEEQLGALDGDLESAADTLEAVAAGIEDPASRSDFVAEASLPRPRPYFEGTTDRLNASFRRIDATREKLAETDAGRAVLRNAAIAAGGAAGAVGLAMTDAISGGVASVISIAASWLYTRIRRVLQDLPARNVRT